MAWAEGTTGTIDSSAPSKVGYGIPVLGNLLALGHVVVSTPTTRGSALPGAHASMESRSESQTILQLDPCDGGAPR